MKKFRKILFGCILAGIVILASFIILHLTPSLAVRTHLLITGHPIAPFTVTVRFNELQQSLDKNSLEQENSQIYCIDGKVKYYDTGNYIFNFKVKRAGFLYFAEYSGEA